MFIFGLGFLHWKTQKYDDAVREFETKMSMYRHNAHALASWGDIELKRRNVDHAFSPGCDIIRRFRRPTEHLVTAETCNRH